MICACDERTKNVALFVRMEKRLDIVSWEINDGCGCIKVGAESVGRSE